MNTGVIRLLGLVVLLFVPARGLGQDFIPLNPKDVALEVEQPQEAIHPFQAIRVRVSIRNISKVPLPRAIHAPLFWASFKRPNEDSFTTLDTLLYRPQKDRTSATTPLEFIHERAPIFLDPGETTSASYAFAANWRSKDGMTRLPFDQGEPIFAEPGTYLVKVLFPLDGREKYLTKEIKVKVIEPAGENKEVFELLRKDRALASALMRSVDAPSKEVVPKLQALLEKYPKTTYTDYARLALVRANFAGMGIEVKSRRIARAIVGDALEGLIRQHYDEKLKDFVLDPFPYRPNAMLLYAVMDMGDRQQMLHQLNRQHPDAMEWIDSFAVMLMNGQTLRGDYELASLVGQVPRGGGAAFMEFQQRVWRAFRKK